MVRERAQDSVNAGGCRRTNVAIDLHKGPVEAALDADERYHMPLDARPTSTTRDREQSHTRPESVHPSVQSGAVAPEPVSRRGLLAWLEARALFITAVAVVIVMSIADIPAHLAQDSYLALVAGRIIAAHGIPHHDYLTVMAHGVRWTDQQWLAQLVMYGLAWLGGLQLLSIAYVLLTGCAFALALVAARRLGGRDVHVLAMLPLGTFFYLATAITIRTQGFAYPLFVATVWLLAQETRRPTGRRAYLVFPLLVVWANLHGSVTLGVAVAMVYGACVLAGSCASSGVRGLRNARGVIFVAGPPLTLLATPYGTSIIHYYHATLFNSEFGKLVTEWRPVTSYMVLAVPLLLLIGGTVWTLGRSGRRTPPFEQIVLGLLAFAAIDAVRNITWFGLAVVILLPSTISILRPSAAPRPRHTRVNLTLALGSLALAALAAVATLGRPTAWFQSTYPRSAVAIAQRLVTADPSTKIFADIRFGDWLVWEDPALAGHIAYDTSLENLTGSQLQALTSLTATPGPGVPNTLGPYRVLMLDPTASNRASNRQLLARPGVHVLLRSKRVVIATKPVT